MTWIKDEDFIRDKVPMTKFYPRMISCCLLDLEEGEAFLDIGAGSGSISIQMASLGAEVTAVESKPLAIDLIKRNVKKFGLDMEVIGGMAPEACPDKTFKGIFLGGNRGRMEDIFSYIQDHLEPGGSLVANFVTLKNASQLRGLLKGSGYDFSLDLIQHSAEDHLGILRGSNPIFIVKGVKP